MEKKEKIHSEILLNMSYQAHFRRHLQDIWQRQASEKISEIAAVWRAFHGGRNCVTGYHEPEVLLEAPHSKMKKRTSHKTVCSDIYTNRTPNIRDYLFLKILCTFANRYWLAFQLPQFLSLNQLM